MFDLRLKTNFIAILLASSMIGLISNAENQFENSASVANDEHDIPFSEEVFATYANGSRYQIIFQEGYNEGNHSSIQRNSINLMGAWNTQLGNKLFIKFAPYNSSISNEVIRDLQQSIYDDPSFQNFKDDANSSKDPLWNNLLLQLSNDSELAPPVLFTAESEERPANVTVILTDKEHPTRPSRNGEAFLGFNDKGEITQVTITIYKASTLYAEGFLAAIFNHELGHAVGLGHSDKLDSIMYPSLVIAENDKGENVAIGNVGTCEFSALTELYRLDNNNNGSLNAKTHSLRCE